MAKNITTKRPVGRPRKLTAAQEAQATFLFNHAHKPVKVLAERFNVTRPTIYAVLNRRGVTFTTK